MRQPSGLAHLVTQLELFIQVDDFSAFSQALTRCCGNKTVALAGILTFAGVFCCFAITRTFAAIDARAMYCVTCTYCASAGNGKA